MADNELMIKINADAKNAKKAFDDVKAQTEDLQSTLNTAGLVGAAAFAGISAAAILSVREFEKAEKATKQVSNALKNQGIFSEQLAKTYEDYADALAQSTAYEKEAIQESQALLQGHLKQTEVTKELSVAVADLAAYKGIDLNSASQLVGRTIGTTTNALAREGLVLKENLTQSERMAAVLDFLSGKYKDAAVTANQGFGGALNQLQKNIGDVAENLGEKLRPALEAATRFLANFFGALKDNPAFANFAISIAAGVAAVGAFLAVLPALLAAFTAIKAALVAIGVTSNIALAGIPIAIGLVVTAATYLALTWDETSKTIVNSFFNIRNVLTAGLTAVWTTIVEIGGGIADTLKGIFTFDVKQIEEGRQRSQNAFAKGAEDFAKTRREYTDTIAEEAKNQQTIIANDAKEKERIEKEAEDKRLKVQQEAARKDRELLAQKLEIQKETDNLAKLQMEKASKESIDLQRQEIETLKALQGENTAMQKEMLTQRLAELRQLQLEQASQDAEQDRLFQQNKLETDQELGQLGIDNKAALNQQQTEQLRAMQLTDLQADREIKLEKMKANIEADNQMLLDRKKYGQTYATLNRALNSEEVNATKSASDQLVGLSKSKNDTLKGIGKAASITQIGIDTAKGAMAVYANFQTAIPYPPVSIPLGLAAAAAITAYGGERIGQVTAAAEGGVITGGIPGRDSVRALLTPGELVAPAKNFEEVVGGVQMARNGLDLSPVVAAISSLGDMIMGIKTTIIQGDVMTDSAYVDALVRQITDAVENRNARLVSAEVL